MERGSHSSGLAGLAGVLEVIISSFTAFIKGLSRDPQGHGTPENGKLPKLFPYHSHIFRDSYGSGMGMVWEASQKGVPLLGFPENPTEFRGAYTPEN